MRPTVSILRVAMALTSVAPIVSAWPRWLPDADALVVRADAPSGRYSLIASFDELKTHYVASASAEPSKTGDSAQATQTGDSSQATQTGDNNKNGDNKGGNAKQTDLNTAKPDSTKSSKGSKTTHHTEYPPYAPPGAVVVTQPATTGAGTALYRIGEYVTFGWNYTNVLATPTAIDVLASCPAASATWTLTQNMTYATAASYVWNTNNQKNNPNQPLLTEKYTLIIKNSDFTLGDTAEPGYFGSDSSFPFGLYASQHYESLKTWKCDVCSAAAHAHPAIKLATTMSIVTVLSFTWFVAGLGLQ